ncbi:MAG: DNA topoisomerase VI subunit B [Candidatus Thermoplasmatota archaeon]|nr:DNA topoisomerase VI subunit B [Candidatus Thermoplasmatota archaeon]
MASIAEKLADKQQEISVGEFFERNKHILGFDSLTKALVTTVKEGVDNSLDACEEAEILPEIKVEIEEVGDREYKVAIEDNGPGIVKRKVPEVFGKLLYGSRFHEISQSRGQQGIGVSAVVMYGQLTTGKPTKVRSKINEKDYANEMKITLDTKKNEPEVLNEEVVLWEGKEHGMRFETTVKGLLRRGKHSVFEYLKNTAIVNPHAKIEFDRDGDKTVFKRATDQLPEKPEAVMPHLKGIELGTLAKMAKNADRRTLKSFLKNEFSRISYSKAEEICEEADIDPKTNPSDLEVEDHKDILNAAEEVKLMSPKTDCLSPIKGMLIKKGLKNVLKGNHPEYYAPPTTRDPNVYSGNPFQVEVGLVYGGELEKEGPVKVLRFANRVPLLYKKGGCATTTAIKNIDWRIYDLDQKGGKGMPSGPAVILIHVASTRVPFTSEAKEAIADIPEVIDEIEKGLRECARSLRTHLNKEKKRKKVKKKFTVVNDILPMIAKKSAEIIGEEPPELDRSLTKIMGVVYIEEESSWEDGRCKMEIEIMNYTPKERDMELFFEKPYPETELLSSNVEPDHEGDHLEWKIEDLEPSETRTFSIEFDGDLEKDDLDGTDIYIEGVGETKLIGAEPLPEDWDIELTDIEEED